MPTQSNECQIILAIQALQCNEKLSRRKAAAIYNVSETTLRARINGRTLKRDCRPNSQKLKETEEEVIVQYILDLDRRGFPSRLADMEEMVNLLLAERVAGRVEKH